MTISTHPHAIHSGKFAALFLGLMGFATPTWAGEGDWKDLLDEELSQWEVFLGVPHKTVEVPGRERTKSEDGIQGGERIGLDDPLDVYTVSMVEGEPVLKVTGEVFGALTTLEEFDSYHLTMQFRWLDKKWEPRLNKKRDSGLLFHCVGEHGVGWNAWMQSMECQIQEGDCGDFIPVDKSRASVQLRDGKEGELEDWEVGIYDPTKPLKEVIGAIATHSGAEEKPHGEWNTIEIYAMDTRAVFIVNGTPNMAIFDIKQTVDGELKPLSRGKLQIQSEAAELEYRRIKIRPIKEFPEELADMVKKPD